MAEVLSPATSLGSLDDYGMAPNASAADWKAKYIEAADMLQDARNELDDFMHSSKELEEELLHELERTEKTQKVLQDKINNVETDRDQWKSKFMSLQTTHNTTVNSLHKELDTLRQEHQKLKTQFRELEMGNDDLERTERAITSSLADAEAKYARVLEEKILLEQELLLKASLEETCQRLRDEVRDANSEITVLREQVDHYKSLPTPTPSAVTDSSPHPSTSTLPGSSLEDEELLKTPPPVDLLLSDATPVPSFGQASSTRPQSSVLPTSQPTSRPTSSASASSLGQAVLLSRAGFPSAAASATPTQATVRPTPSPSRLPAPRTPRQVSVTRPAVPATNGTTAINTKSKGVQMVTEMRARVKNLEQRLQSRVPRIRSVSIKPSDAKDTRDQAILRTQSPQAADLSRIGAESPGWVLVNEESPMPPKGVSALGMTGIEKRISGTGRPSPPTAFKGYGASPNNESPSNNVGAFKRPPSRVAAPALNVHSSIPSPTSRPTTPTFLPIASAYTSNAAKRASVPAHGRRGSLGGALTSSRESPVQNPLYQGRSFTNGSMLPPPVPPVPPPKETKESNVTLSTSTNGKPLFKATTAKSLLASSRIGRPMSLGSRRQTEKKLAALEDQEVRTRSGSIA